MAGAVAGGGLPEAPRLPPLREDLAIAEGPFLNGQPTWTIYDPSAHGYVRVGWLEFEILSRWGLGDPAAVAADVSASTALSPTAADVAAFSAFAYGAGLLQATSAGSSAAMAARARARRHGPAAWLMHNYLFLRLRLVNPDRFLADMLPWVGWAFSRGAAAALAAVVLAGGFLVARQWQEYAQGLAGLVSLQGAAAVAVALSASKVAHELGHGFAAKAMGCRVPSMGVAFLVMWPVLWTDTTDAWKLVRRRDRLLIDAAGVLAEISLAAAATLAWAVLPDGPAKGAALTLSGSTWLLTLAVNLNPLMRFDGYYLLSDALEIANLQDRGFALARWRMRESLLGLGEPPPERLPARARAAVYLWAYSTWAYRFALFLGIALLVYHMAFKALGFVLMGIEIWFFLARPILREIRIWGSKVAGRGFNRHSAATLLLLGAAGAACLLPWQARVHAPAVLRSARQAVLYVDQPGRLAEMRPPGYEARAGEAAFRLESLEADHALAAASARLEGLEAAMRGQAFGDRLSSIGASAQEAGKAAAEIAAGEARIAALTVRAPFDGIIVDVPSSLRVGADLPRREPLGMIVDPSGSAAEAFVREGDVERISAGARARFVPEDGEPIDMIVESVAPSPSRVMDAPELASVNGGPVPSRKDAQGRILPEGAVYRVVLRPAAGTGGTAARRRGVASIEGERISPARAAWRRAVAVLVRETGL